MYLGMRPLPAVRTALARAGLLVGDIDVIELNEAFVRRLSPSSVSSACHRPIFEHI
jgi:Thiolase, C-terminal domain